MVIFICCLLALCFEILTVNEHTLVYYGVNKLNISIYIHTYTVYVLKLILTSITCHRYRKKTQLSNKTYHEQKYFNLSIINILISPVRFLHYWKSEQLLPKWRLFWNACSSLIHFIYTVKSRSVVLYVQGPSLSFPAQAYLPNHSLCIKSSSSRNDFHLYILRY